MLDSGLKEQLKTYLGYLQAPIELIPHLNDSTASIQTLELVNEVAQLSDLVSVVMHGNESSNSEHRTPSFQITRPNENVGVEFAGLPMGHEFTSLVLALLHVGGHPAKISDDIKQQIQSLDGDYVFETYFSQSCQNCPDVVQALNTMAALNPRIRHTAIDGGVFPLEVEERNILAVPSVYLNGEIFGQGRMSLEQILSQLDSGAARRTAEKLSQKEPYDVLIVGGGPAGAAAAVYAARKGIRVGLVAERFGGQVMDTMAIENYISVLHTEGPILGSALEQHVLEYGVEVMTNQKAQKLYRHDGLHHVELESGADLKGKTIVLAPGARWRQTGVPGEEQYRNKGVTYCPHCDGPLFKGKRVVVIGGGNSGVEAAIDLAGIVKHVTLLEFSDTLKADEVLQHKLRSLGNVSVVVSANTQEIKGNGQQVTSLVYKDRHSGVNHSVATDGVFVQIGLLPNTEWLDNIERNAVKEIEINARGETSIPGVFAAGDATTEPFKQIVVAAGGGATAALAAFEYLMRQ